MVTIHGKTFQVAITRIMGMRNLRMRLKDDTLLVSCGKLVPECEIYRFIKTKEEWIWRHYQKMEKLKETSFMYRGGDTVFLFGEAHPIVIQEGRSSFRMQGETLVLTYMDNDPDKILHFLYKHLDRYLLEEAKPYAEKYQDMLRDYGYTEIPSFKARIMKSKWGVCFTRENRITLSSYLVHFPKECLEYIVLHEMTHFLVPNHSKRFYEIIRSRMPDYKTVLKQLHM